MNRNSQLKLSVEYRQALIIAIAVLIHLAFSTFITLMLLLGLPKYNDLPDDGQHENNSTRLVGHWAAFCGVLSAVLACFQYWPQLLHTYRAKLVGCEWFLHLSGHYFGRKADEHGYQP